MSINKIYNRKGLTCKEIPFMPNHTNTNAQLKAHPIIAQFVKNSAQSLAVQMFILKYDTGYRDACQNSQILQETHLHHSK